MRSFALSDGTSKKNAAKTRRRKLSCDYSVNLLANDARIILRKSEASLMLLF
jgi:hypothetical protein